MHSSHVLRLWLMLFIFLETSNRSNIVWHSLAFLLLKRNTLLTLMLINLQKCFKRSFLCFCILPALILNYHCFHYGKTGVKLPVAVNCISRDVHKEVLQVQSYMSVVLTLWIWFLVVLSSVLVLGRVFPPFPFGWAWSLSDEQQACLGIQLKINPTQKMVVCIQFYLSTVQWKRSAFVLFCCYYYYYYFLALTLAIIFSETAIMESVLVTWSKEKGVKFPRCCTGSQCAFWASIEGIWSMWV